MVLLLEAAIEWLGHEPERRWENILFLRGVEIRTPSPEVLSRRARTLAEQGDGEGALRLYVKVLELDPDNTLVLDAAGELLAELGDAEGAKELLHKSIELSPRKGHEKFLLLGHLNCGASAISSFEKALDLLDAELRCLSGPGAENDNNVMFKRQGVKKKMSEVLTSIAKVYLTDCFMEKDAHKTCEELLDQSLQYDPDNPESTQALADLRLSQGRRGEALVMIRRTMELCANLDDGLAPSYDFRCVTARLLVELSQYELAELVLVELIGEDDQDTEVWYLLGLCYLLCNMPKKCREALKEAKTLLQCNSDSNTTLMNQINSLLERRSIAEEEKHIFWNPRWWINTNGSASAKNALEQNGETSEVHGANETSIMLAPFNIPCSDFPAIPEEPDDNRMLMAL